MAIVFAVLGAVLVAAAAALVAFNFNYSNSAGQKAEEALEAVERQIPPFALGDYRALSGGLASVEADGLSYVGVLDAPSLGLRLPVLAAAPDEDHDFAPYLSSRDAATGALVIGGANYASQLGRIPELAAGDELSFTDVAGNARSYEVMSVATVGADDPSALADTCAGWSLSLFTNTFSGMQRTVVCCRDMPGE